MPPAFAPLLLVMLPLCACPRSASASWSPFLPEVPDPRLRPYQKILSELALQPDPSSVQSRQENSSTMLSPTGSTLDPCFNNSHCLPERYCVNLISISGSEPILCSGPTLRCACLSALPRKCTATSQCPDNEVCTSFGTSVLLFCVSAYVFDTNLAFRAAPTDPPPSPIPQGVSGLTLDFCQSDDQCLPGRSCTLLSRFGEFSGEISIESTEPCDSRDPCVCLPPTLIFCNSTSECPVGEVCTSSVFEYDVAVCISDSTQNFLEIGSEVVESPPPLSSEFPPGLTLDSCATADIPSTFCRGDRSCISYPNVNSGSGSCFGQSSFGDCRCYPVPDATVCSSSEECERGEVCSEEISRGRNICMSELAVTRQPPANVTEELTAVAVPSAGPSMGSMPSESNPEPGAEAEINGSPSTDDQNDEEQETSNVICIAVESLQQFARKDLVYERDGWAWVLCDAGGSCATAGHMVVFEGRAMRMGRYCRLAVGGCRRRKMRVNSPRWRRGLRVGSRSAGLEFTAFAARYDTVVEETVLAAAVHAGL